MLFFVRINREVARLNFSFVYEFFGNQGKKGNMLSKLVFIIKEEVNFLVKENCIFWYKFQR